MEIALLLGLVACFVALQARYALARRPKLVADAARVLELERPAPGRALGRVRGVPVAIELEPRGGRLQLEVGPAVATPTRLLVRQRRANTSRRRDGSFGCGDPAFDAALRFEGDEAAVLALLDPRARQQLRELLDSRRRRGVVQDGKVWVELLDEGAPADPQALADLLRRMVCVAKMLAESDAPLPERLAHNARHDPAAGVRERNLGVLVRRFPSDAATTVAARRAIDDAEPRVRLLAARALGEDGWDELESLATGRHNEARVRAEALRWLCAEAPPERSTRAIEAALEAPPGPPLIEALGASGRIGLAAARLHARRWLDDEEADLAVRLAAAEALGKVGAHEDVPRLVRWTRGLFARPELKRAARAAVQRIHTRLGEVDAGRLTLCEVRSDPRGRLTSADERAGRVSVEQVR